MKIRLSELRTVIKEEVESAAAYKRWKKMQDVHGFSPDDKMVHAGKYNYFKNDLSKLFDMKSSAANYEDFFSAVKRAGFNYPPSRISDLYNSSFKTPEDLSAAVSEMNDLDARFKKEEVSDETDAIYGRKSYQVIDTKTGNVVDRYSDRRGSLGT